MKNTLYKIATIASLSVMWACGKSEEPVPHIVGNWKLQTFNYMKLPPGYSSYRPEDLEFTVEQFGLDSYILEISNDKKVIRKIDPSDGRNENTEGAWELKGTEGDQDLIITYVDQDDPSEFHVDKNALDQLWLSTPSTDVFISDDTQDSLVDHHGSAAAANTWLQTWYASFDESVPAHVDTFYMVFDEVDFDLQLSFIRAN